MTLWKTLIRREYWEHRGLWVGPVVTAGVMVVGSFFALLRFGELNLAQSSFRFSIGDGPARLADSVLPVAVPMLLIGAIGISLYLLDCLYAERKDRSILFWKSLPVSDAQTVIAKLAVALVVTPLGLCALAAVTHLICLGMLRIWAPVAFASDPGWSLASQLGAYGFLFGMAVVNVVWYLPLVGYSLLCSVLARRSPLLIAALPLILLPLAERMAFGTALVGGWLGERSRPVTDALGTLFGLELWVGVLVGVALIAAVIRLRRWRDDS